MCVRNGMTGRDSEKEEHVFKSDGERLSNKIKSALPPGMICRCPSVEGQLMWANAENSSLQNFMGGATLEARRGKHIQ